jgi:hypothetical protein
MESFLLTGVIYSVIWVAYSVFRNERAGGRGGLGLFSYKKPDVSSPPARSKRKTGA